MLDALYAKTKELRVKNIAVRLDSTALAQMYVRYDKARSGQNYLYIDRNVDNLDIGKQLKSAY